MRPVLAAQLCLAVFQAFLLAPAQHVHDGDEAEGHEHSTVVHSHFAAHRALSVRPGELGIGESEEHEVWSLDTFTIVPPAGFQPLLLSLAPEALSPLQTALGAVSHVEERAHDPPHCGASIPRAPPA